MRKFRFSALSLSHKKPSFNAGKANPLSFRAGDCGLAMLFEIFGAELQTLYGGVIHPVAVAFQNHGIGKMRLCAKRENRGGRPPFCGGTTPNNLSVNSEKVLAGWAAIRQINLPAGKKSNMSAPFCSFTKGREKEYNLNNRHRKYTVRQDRNAQYQLMQGDCHIWRVSCIGSRNGDLP